MSWGRIRIDMRLKHWLIFEFIPKSINNLQRKTFRRANDFMMCLEIKGMFALGVSRSPAKVPSLMNHLLTFSQAHSFYFWEIEVIWDTTHLTLHPGLNWEITVSSPERKRNLVIIESSFTSHIRRYYSYKIGVKNKTF